MTSPTMISLPRLVSTCADAARRGCLVIRSVQARREAVISATAASSASAALEEASSHGIKYKVDGDPRSALTEADGAAQQVILDCLRHGWGTDLKIVGEEDENNDEKDEASGDEEEEEEGGGDVFDRYNVPRPTDVPLYEDLISNTGGGGDVPLSSVTIFVDPMDGTREYVVGRLGNVQCLIGITVDGKPIGGVVGLPFAGGKTETEEGKSSGDVGPVQVVYALQDPSSEATAMLGRVAVSANDAFDSIPFLLSDSGDTNGEAATSTCKDAPRRLVVLSGDSKKPEKDRAICHLRDICAEDGVELDIRVAGGCGNKMLQVALTAASGKGDAIAVAPRGTCSWDTAAPTALLQSTLKDSSCPGLVSDFYGKDLVYNGINVTNSLGVLASCGENGERWHRELCKRLLKDNAVS